MTTAQYAETYPYDTTIELLGDSVRVQTRVESDGDDVDAVVLLDLSSPEGVGLTAREARTLARVLLEAAEAADEAEDQ
jgi:hypothetical protein